MKYRMKKYLAVFFVCVLACGLIPQNDTVARAEETEEDSLTIEGYSPYSTKNAEVLYGEDLTLSVKASSTVSDVFYQWQSGPEENKAADIAGAVGAEYTITDAGVDTPKFFQCLVWDENHTEDKRKVRFNVRVETILLPDGNTKENWSYYPHAWEGNEITLSPQAQSPFEITYQWAYYDDADNKLKDMENETGGSYTFSYTADSPGRYQCRIQNAYGKKIINYYLNRHTADEPEPVKMEFSPTIRDWYIYEQTGDNLMSLSSYTNNWPEQKGAIKITHKDGSELYTSSNYSQSAVAIEKNEDGSWKAGDYPIVYGYMNLTESLNIHIVRIGENGSDLFKGTPNAAQTAGKAAPDYQYYRISPEASGTYEVNLSNVNGAGKINLYKGSVVNDGSISLNFYSQQEMAFSGAEDSKMTLSLDGGIDYFLVVRADDADVTYDIVFDEFVRMLPLDTPVSVDGNKDFTFVPQKSGYYTLEYLSNYEEQKYYTAYADAYTAGMNRAGSLNEDSSLYLRSGVRYNIVLSSNYEGVPDYETVRLKMVSEASHPENIVQAVLSNGMTVKLDEEGLLSYEKSGDETEGEIISETRDGHYGVLADNAMVKKIVIEEGIRKLGNETFYAFENLEEATLPASLEEIGTGSFSNCTKLETVNLPEENNISFVGEEVFLSTPFLNNQTGNYKMLGTIVLKYTGEETETLIPQKATVIGGAAMRGSETLEKITILDKVKVIGSLGMADCTSLPEIDIPGNVTDISYCAFYHNTALEQAVLNEGVESIGEEAFFACTNLKKIYIPKSVNYIGGHAIGYADWSWNSYSYNLAEELPTIYCYYNTAGYRYAKSNQIPYKLLDEKNLANEDLCYLSYSYSYGRWPVRLDKLTVRFADSILEEGKDYAVSYEDASDKTKTVAVITGIGDYFGKRTAELSFHPQGGGNSNSDNGNSSQNEINQSKIPQTGKTLTEPGTGISYRVTNADVNHPEVEFLDANGTAKGTIKIPNTILIDGITYQVTGIAAGAFSKNKALKRVEIGSGVKTIGKNAFSGCSGLTAVSGGANLVSIGDNAFLKCTSLKKFTIGKNVSKIGKKAFGGCKKLKSITIKTTKLTKKSIGKGAFSGTPSNAKVSVPKKKLKSYKTILKSKGISKKAKIK